MSVSVKFEYDIGDKVNILDVDIPGRVTSLIKDTNGLQYLIAYWHNGERHSTWLFDWELERKKK